LILIDAGQAADVDPQLGSSADETHDARGCGRGGRAVSTACGGGRHRAAAGRRAARRAGGAGPGFRTRSAGGT